MTEKAIVLEVLREKFREYAERFSLTTDELHTLLEEKHKIKGE